mmetsp:Transcript_29157/g.53564  ORF Transcript_29157/g.53564 Transcript_29157/m.53564 type:complete len:217 (-) Transcript_29157:383-1033(-)
MAGQLRRQRGHGRPAKMVHDISHAGLTNVVGVVGQVAAGGAGGGEHVGGCSTLEDALDGGGDVTTPHRRQRCLRFFAGEAHVGDRLYKAFSGLGIQIRNPFVGWIWNFKPGTRWIRVRGLYDTIQIRAQGRGRSRRRVAPVTIRGGLSRDTCIRWIIAIICSTASAMTKGCKRLVDKALKGVRVLLAADQVHRQRANMEVRSCDRLETVIDVHLEG